MEKLTTADLYSLEHYAEVRPELRARVLEHKRQRKVAIGPHATLYFEDRLTIQYQVQEMLRVERIFERAAIEEELAAYNPLIPDGNNLKATFMLEYEDVAERRKALARLVGIEDRVWVAVAGFDRVYAVADEDLDRDTSEKTSSVHFLRFDLTPPMCAALRQGAALSVGTDYEGYRYEVQPVPEPVRAALAADVS